MRKDLVYQSPNWEKEKKHDAKIQQQLKDKLKGKDSTLDSLERLIQEEKEFPELRNYGSLYNHISLKYRMLAGKVYLRNLEDQKCIEYTYLSGVSAVLAYLFYVNDPPKELDKTDRENIISDFTGGVLRLYAVDQPLPSCTYHIDNPYVQLLLGNLDKAASLLNKLGSQFNPAEPYQFWIDESEHAIIQAAIEKDGQKLKDLLVQCIREYRKVPRGYTTFLDTYAIALIKLARTWGEDININVIEIPSMFFGETICKINPLAMQVPFFEEAKNELKKYGVTFEL